MSVQAMFYAKENQPSRHHQSRRRQCRSEDVRCLRRLPSLRRVRGDRGGCHFVGVYCERIHAEPLNNNTLSEK